MHAYIATHTSNTHRLSKELSIWSTGKVTEYMRISLGIRWVNIVYCPTCETQPTNSSKQIQPCTSNLSSPCTNSTAVLSLTIVKAAMHSCVKAPGQGSIWLLNLQWSRQCLKYTGWMGLPSNRRGTTVHYLLKLPINFLSHSPCLCHLQLVYLSHSLSPSCLSPFISANITHSFCFVYQKPLLFPCLTLFLPSSLPRALSCIVLAYLFGHFNICCSLCCVHWVFLFVCFFSHICCPIFDNLCFFFCLETNY